MLKFGIKLIDSNRCLIRIIKKRVRLSILYFVVFKKVFNWVKDDRIILSN